MPDPFEIGHGLGSLFWVDGAFKAGCGTEAEEVSATGAWIARGICEGQLRSLAVFGNDGEKGILYGAAARFALDAAADGELVSAEAAEPEGGDVFVVTTLEGAYGFSRRPAEGGDGASEAQACTDVTGTDRPLAELPPAMLLHWKNLLDDRAAWSWPVIDGTDDRALVFTASGSEEVVATGSCSSLWSCSLASDGPVSTIEGRSWVTLDDLSLYMPPEED
jgi:hypothetical protein